jgi:2-polyprenyl-6-methoxyphenol hydroxylase-like FAD-dependent oxidoreductase
MTSETLTTTCCIAGGGPAGMMLGLLLARAGIDVVVLEKHADFLRDFRGDTIHPSTLEVMKELGFLDEFLTRPHQKLYQLTGFIGNAKVVIADFSHLPVQCPYIALMPQWDFLNFLSEKAKAYPHFHLRMQTQATELIEENGQVAGVVATTPEGTVTIHASLTIGADGRHSTIRAKAGLAVEESGTPIDVLWMRLSRKDSDSDQALARINRGKVLVMLYRGDYWQCAYVISKGGFETIKAKGLDQFRKDIVDIAPFLQDRVQEIDDWNLVKLLTVKVDCLQQWSKPGLLCIGDAAHAMSPIGGVGINLAIQDAVATANILAKPLKAGCVSNEDLKKVQCRRTWPTRMTQRIQVLAQNRIFNPILHNPKEMAPPLILKLFNHMPILRRIPARIVGMGFRPEHIRTPN